MLMKFAYWLVVSVLLLISACGGTVSTQPVADSSPDVTPYQTTEYYRSSALNQVNAADVYARGGTGQGITLAVMDSGINSSHAQLTGQVSANGYDYVTGQSGVAVDGTGHGTHIAGLMVAKKDGQAMHGLAYDATLLPIRVLDNAGTTAATTDSEMAAASALAMAQGSHIFNNSWGHSGTNILSAIITSSNVNSWHANFLVQARAAIAQDSVYVWAAGNQSATELTYHAGLPYLLNDLQAGWLAVTAVDNNGALASYANHCGVAAAWCLAAPGGGNVVASDGLYSTDVGGGHAYRAGTSMAAPQVSAAMAILKPSFPR
jgi:subtilisin family serine protease